MARPGARRIIQLAWAALTNGYLPGFASGTIYTGPLKSLCLPGLNCYSCPGALGACPIGALQAVVGSARYHIPLYLAGFFLLVGTVLGRFVCGFLCPFGLIQELLQKIPFPKKIKTFRLDRPLRFLKYGILAVFVILIPLFVVDAAGSGAPAFCQWICPAGTLEAGLPLVFANPVLQQAVGFLYTWKLVLLAATIFLSVLIYRPFCRYICPLGAIYALFNRVSLYRYTVSATQCTGCGGCQSACPMQLDPCREANHPECVRCGACKKSCPQGAITAAFGPFGAKSGKTDKGKQAQAGHKCKLAQKNNE